jgi:tetratricopeptide (TPR) repeat protein
VEVRDPELATALRAREEFAGAIDFDVVDALEAADFLLAEMRRDLFPQRTGSPLDSAGVTVDRVRGFAEACAAFHAARPWRHLHDDDLIVVEAPPPPAGMRGAAILGAAGQVMGIAFYPDEAAHDRILDSPESGMPTARRPLWSLMFHAPDELPPDDADLWQRQGLPVAADDSVPLLLKYHGSSKITRPDGGTLTFAEGLCRAVAATTEEEIDAGRWEKTVETSDGPVRFALTIPHLLRPRGDGSRIGSPRVMMEKSMRQIIQTLQHSGAQSIDEMNALLDAQVNGRVLDEVPDAGPRTAAERAQDLCYEAEGQRSRRQFQLLREALQVDPECADAYAMLARRHSDPVEAEALYRRAIEAGRRSLGPDVFNDPEYPFWGALESRPFMRAMAELAEVLKLQGRLSEAADVYGEMLRLNPGDNQGVRYNYLPVLIALGRLDAARALIESDDYRGDGCAVWDYSAALLAFKQGRSADAEHCLKRAVVCNPMVPGLIERPELVPPGGLDTWSPGTESEAVMVADLLGDVWRADASATRWLRSTASTIAPARKQRRSRQQGTKSTKPKPKRKRK